MHSISRVFLWVCLSALAAHTVSQSSLAEDDIKIIANGRFSPHGGKILFPAKSGRTSGVFLIDTGSRITDFFKGWRHLAGRELEQVTLNGPEIDALHSSTPSYAAPEATIGGMLLRKDTPIVAVTTLGDLFGNVRIKADGMLGMDVLQEYVLHLDFDRSEWRVLRAYAPMDGREYAVRLSTSGPGEACRCSVYFPQVGPIEFILDTGNLRPESATLDAATYKLLESKGVLQTIQPAWRSPLAEEDEAGLLRFAETSVHRVGYLTRAATLGEMALPECAFFEGQGNTLGLGFLSRFVVTFDFPKKVVYLRPGKQLHRRERLKISGLLAVDDHGRTKVLHVVPESPCAKAGIQKGDFLTQVGQHSPDEMTLMEIEQALGELDTTVPVTLDRRGERIKVSVKSPDIKPPKIIDVDKIPGKKYLD